MISNLTKSKNIVRYIKNMILKKLNAGDQMKGILNALVYLFRQNANRRVYVSALFFIVYLDIL
jgi:hypothetical protein